MSCESLSTKDFSFTPHPTPYKARGGQANSEQPYVQGGLGPLWMASQQPPMASNFKVMTSSRDNTDWCIGMEGARRWQKALRRRPAARPRPLARAHPTPSPPNTRRARSYLHRRPRRQIRTRRRRRRQRQRNRVRTSPICRKRCRRLPLLNPLYRKQIAPAPP